ncbi:MAG TPA: hypothetical protein VKM93_09625 [Terriglobia bacterium]|nr:hypothetical protein [Terriglobia bacterium]
MTLAVPLLNSQIEAASRFWSEGWESKELVQLKQVFPKPLEAIKLKAVVLNVLYGTNIMAILRVGQCLEEKLKATNTTGPDLVEELVTEISAVTNRKHYSFVAKFAHFFIDPDLPILDQYAEYMVQRHLGAGQSKNPKRYLKFAEDIEKLKQLAGLSCNCAQLDAFLWIAGEYWGWKGNPKLKISTDLMPYFQRLQEDPGSEPTLRDLLGLSASKA